MYHHQEELNELLNNFFLNLGQRQRYLSSCEQNYFYIVCKIYVLKLCTMYKWGNKIERKLYRMQVNPCLCESVCGEGAGQGRRYGGGREVQPPPLLWGNFCVGILKKRGKIRHKWANVVNPPPPPLRAKVKSAPLLEGVVFTCLGAGLCIPTSVKNEGRIYCCN